MRGRALQIVRHTVQSAVLLLFLCVGLLGFFGDEVMGEGVFFGSLSSSTIADTVVLTDPFAFLQVIVASQTVPLALLGGVLTAAIIYTLVRGRVFCGWVCPLGLLTELANWIGDKTGLRRRAPLTRQMPRYGKIIAAALVLLASALVSMPVFELISPVTALPRLFVLGVGIGVWLLCAIILVELFFPGRLWCTSLCPVGGLYEVLGLVGFVGIRNHEGCIQCDRCKQVCLADERILDEVITGTKTAVSAGDCMVCGKCVAACPEKTLSWRFGPAFFQPPQKKRQVKTLQGAEAREDSRNA